MELCTRLLAVGLILTAFARVSAYSFGSMKTLFNIGFRNESSFRAIQEDRTQPGVLIAILSNAIVKLEVEKPQNLVHIAGVSDLNGFRGGYGANIRFSNPWDLIQLNQNQWIISDSGNNCLRTFHPRRNERKEGAIRDWSEGCNNNANVSSITSSVSGSYFYRPRSLTYLPDEDKLYVTYEQPYAIAIIYTSAETVTILYSSTSWPLRQLVPFNSELIISTEPIYYMFSLRDSQLGLVVDEYTWNSNVPAVADYMEYSAGIVSLPGEQDFLETVSNSHVLAHIDQKRKVITKVCTGIRGHVDSDLVSCQLDTPTCITRINNTLYIGESGWSGGGIRYVEIILPEEDRPSSRKPLILGLSISAGGLIILISIAGLIIYRKRKARMVNQVPEVPIAAPATIAQPTRPVPAPRTYGTRQPIHSPAYVVPHEDDDEYSSYAYIAESRHNSRYEHVSIDSPPRPYSELFPREEENSSTHSEEGSNRVTMVTDSGMTIYTAQRTAEFAQELSDKLSEVPCKPPDYEGPDQPATEEEPGTPTEKLSSEPTAPSAQLSVDLPSEAEDSGDEKPSDS